MRQKSAILALVLLGLFVGGGELLALETELVKPPLPLLPDDYWPRLGRGEVVVMHETIDDGDQRSYVDLVELIMIEAPVEEVYKVISDCAGFSDYQPNVDRVILLDGAGDASKVLAHSWRFELSAFFIDIVYHIITMSDRRSHVVEFELNASMENDIQKSQGHWWLYPINEGANTLIVYALQAESGIPLPQFIEDYAAENSLKDILINTRYRVHSRGNWKRGDDPPAFSAFGQTRELGEGTKP